MSVYYAVVNKNSNLVAHISDKEPVITTHYMQLQGGARAYDINSDTHEVVKVIDPPISKGAALRHLGGGRLDFLVAGEPAKNAKIKKLASDRERLISAPINNVQVERERDQLELQSSIDNFTQRVIALRNDVPEFAAIADSLPDPNVIPYLGVDGTPLFLTLDDLKNIKEEYEARYTRLWFKFGLLVSSVNKATTIDEINNIGF